MYLLLNMFDPTKNKRPEKISLATRPSGSCATRLLTDFYCLF